MSNNAQETLSPVELYHRIWSVVPQVFWFQDRLAQWSDWEHKFDGELSTEADAFRCGTLMVSSLNERYTELLAPEPEAEEDEATAPCCSSSMLAGEIGYLKIRTFSGKGVAVQIREAIESIANACAFVIDLRGNSGGFIGQANKALSSFMDQGGTYILKERRLGEGYFEAYCRIEPEGFAERVEYSSKDAAETDTWNRYENITGSKPMVVLINGRTGSASEFFAGVLRDCGRAVLLGTQTAGKGIAQNTLDVGNGYKLQITDGVFLPPSEQWFGDHGQTVDNGILPHITVHLEQEGDSQMTAALEHLSHSLQAACMHH